MIFFAGSETPPCNTVDGESWAKLIHGESSVVAGDGPMPKKQKIDRKSKGEEEHEAKMEIFRIQTECMEKEHEKKLDLMRARMEIYELKKKVLLEQLKEYKP